MCDFPRGSAVQRRVRSNHTPHRCDLVSIAMGPGESLVLSVPCLLCEMASIRLSQGRKAKVCIKYSMSPACSACKLQVHYSEVPALFIGHLAG